MNGKREKGCTYVQMIASYYFIERKIIEIEKEKNIKKQKEWKGKPRKAKEKDFTQIKIYFSNKYLLFLVFYCVPMIKSLLN